MIPLEDQIEDIKKRGEEHAHNIEIIRERLNYLDINPFKDEDLTKHQYVPRYLKQLYIYTHRIILGVPCKTAKEKKKYANSTQVKRKTKAIYRSDDERYCTLLPGFVPLNPSSAKIGRAIGCSCLSLAYRGPTTGQNKFMDPLIPGRELVRSTDDAAQNGCKHIIAYNIHTGQYQEQ